MTLPYPVSPSVPGDTADTLAVQERWDTVVLRNETVAHFVYRFRVRNAGGPKAQRLRVPVGFDRNKGRRTWQEVIDPASILTVEPRARPVAFQPVDPPNVRDQVCGYFTPEFLFHTHPDQDDLAFGYDTADVFPHMRDGIECVYVDIFTPMDRATLRVRGDGFHVRPRPGDGGDELSRRCSAEELVGFDTRHEELVGEMHRATDGVYGRLTVESGPLGFDEVVWTLQNPRLNTRYKIFFQANPVRAEPPEPPVGHLSPGVAAQRAELYRLIAEFHRGNLAQYAGEFVLAADGQVLDHDPDAFALRERAADVARQKAVPADRVVEYYVPTLD